MRCVSTCSSLTNACVNLASISQAEPKTFAEVEKDEYLICAMREELYQFERNEV